MGIEIIATLVSAVAAGLGFAGLEIVQKLVRQLLGVQEEPKPYGVRLGELTQSLSRASREVDAVLAELAQVARDRESAVHKLETDLASLEQRERELKTTIEALEKTPLPVAEHFAKLLESGERRSARRDYALFGAGVLVTTVISAAVVKSLTRVVSAGAASC